MNKALLTARFYTFIVFIILGELSEKIFDYLIYCIILIYEKADFKKASNPCDYL